MRFILLLVVLAGCGHVDAFVCDGEMVSELCLYKGDFDINSAAITDTIEIVQEVVSTEYPGLDLPYMLGAYDVFAKYKSRDAMPGGARGIYRFVDHRILVNGIESLGESGEANLICREHYYVLGHEMLHFIIDEYLDASYEANSWHTHPFFIQADEDGNYPGIAETVEGRIYIGVIRLCNDLVGPLNPSP